MNQLLEIFSEVLRISTFQPTRYRDRVNDRSAGWNGEGPTRLHHERRGEPWLLG